MESTMITIQFNGKTQEVAAATSVLQLLELAQIKTRYCAVEKNGEIVPRSNYASTPLVDGDQLEVVTLVGGG